MKQAEPVPYFDPASMGGAVIYTSLLTGAMLSKYQLSFPPTHIEKHSCIEEIENDNGKVMLIQVFTWISIMLLLAARRWVGRRVVSLLSFVGVIWIQIFSPGVFVHYFPVPECAHNDPQLKLASMFIKVLAPLGAWMVLLEFGMNAEFVKLSGPYDLINIISYCFFVNLERDENGKPRVVTSAKEYFWNLGKWILKAAVLSTLLPVVTTVMVNAMLLRTRQQDGFLEQQFHLMTRLLHFWIFFDMGTTVPCVIVAILGRKPKHSMKNPLNSASFSEFWASRWNTRVSIWLKNCVYKPILRAFTSQGSTKKPDSASLSVKFYAISATFMLSAYLHELENFHTDRAMYIEELTLKASEFKIAGRWVFFCLACALLVFAEKKFEKILHRIPMSIRNFVFVVVMAQLCGWLLEFNDKQAGPEAAINPKIYTYDFYDPKPRLT
mmetsp:Transcript_9553/g.13353  ORF Transcript_9553/g.13353 Transcript_9553/m.13353 type:complete len:438 (+) Transcript_9553:321-1634(+)